MNDKEKRLVDLSFQTGVSNWLSVLPVTEFGFGLSSNSASFFPYGIIIYLTDSKYGMIV